MKSHLRPFPHSYVSASRFLRQCRINHLKLAASSDTYLLGQLGSEGKY